ncbi:protein-glutamate methylesterase/protein-glutamine glutaminase [Neptunomonas qingdaonensis]|uniref:Protein-glutamate methylesterase/protein-glutamine glutaminase n=1 Tax=Neptunomonas qingdaonensis TaxID=1045558 RepID=A0A1I2N0L1_9GAMM|nr:chemotaxis response regulator protein-glutamate methylesterase [Neptunomonas qingdaonensis]SFF96670.1 two-component system, chemotaxis family, response regulator CheB [Neptunomonas qingdaonensis]
MPVKVLIVDDSSFFRQRITDFLSSDKRLEVIGTASNGREAVELTKQLKPDVVTMDVEMPLLNGIDAVRIIMRDNPTNVLMLSSLTHEGAQVTLQALEAGAVDYLTKDIRSWVNKSNSMQNDLVERIVALGRSKHRHDRSAFAVQPPKADPPSVVHSPRTAAVQADSLSQQQQNPRAIQRKSTFTNTGAKSGVSNGSAASNGSVVSSGAAELLARKRGGKKASFPDSCKLVVIGASTGGPAALQTILTGLSASFPYPLLLVQHMPKTFTSVFATRLNQQCSIEVKEAEDGDKLKPGCALLVPGGHQVMIDSRHSDRVRILPGDERMTYRPSVDVAFGAAAKVYANKVLAIILTGMGADGAEGARLLKQAGAVMWAQNEASCTIYGMPQAIVKAGLADDILDLNDIGPLLMNRGKL